VLNTNPNGTEAIAAGISLRACVARESEREEQQAITLNAGKFGRLSSVLFLITSTAVDRGAAV
jgi:hypothetical protein